MSPYDLHCHSRVSDGTLSPRELVLRACEQGVKVLALTDHDDVRGLAEARAAAEDCGIELVAGVEVSVTWGGNTVHIVGLQVDPEHEQIVAGLERNRAGRAERARKIAEALAKLGIAGALEGAYALAENKELIGRSHFARFLVEKGHVRNIKAVFKKYLVKGKPGYVHHEWAQLAEAVGWIRAAGGMAVLAHPGRYMMGKEKRHLLFEEFKAAGGEAVEVVCGSHTQDQALIYADYAQTYGLYASVGSDFHAPGENGRELGKLPPLPEHCRPVWSAW
ncbi:hypothetical protein EDC61_109117 [Sulfuritortus calidifontis]|uniref:Polymerase/histidinol phosphatase N-terminal domain-containing protein n=1 Tax=Sulfuritortus calidifontis TaxID=1914471 RepID=A0A4V2UQN0_9PROT|nr:3',5'-nucleoside bisphosphate phosphatase [Sulfuritortus calidifontis]TCS71571.1 hypothetical protein EDC61_109117 [Sulfuritortus calidifontis]